jgi:CHASE2 domain-containing sensor protein
MIYYVIVMAASILLIQGTQNRDHTKMMLFMILMVVGIFMSFLQMFSLGLAGLPIAFVSAAIDIYFFICIYSLYDLFRNERMGGARSNLEQTIVYTQPMQQTSVVYPPQQPVVYAQQPVIYTQQQPQTFVQPMPTSSNVNVATAPVDVDERQHHKVAL